MEYSPERRIYPPRELEDTLNQLVNPINGEPAPFLTKQKAMMFAAALGFHRNRSEPFKSKAEGIRMDIFQRPQDDYIIHLLAVAKVRDLGILAPDREDERITIFEEYAHGGLLEMQRYLSSPSAKGSMLDSLIQLTAEVRHKTEDNLDDNIIRLMNMDV